MNQSFRVGGLMRCCIAALGSAPDDAPEGTVHACPSCGTKVSMRDGVWEWVTL